MPKTYLSPEAFESMKEELLELLSKERPKVTEQVSAAAALGDRSENAEYIYGKKRLREIDKRVRFLQSRLSDVEVITQKEVSVDEIRFGTWVKTKTSEDVFKIFQITGPDEVDSSGEKITYTSPLGQAILGKVVGDKITIKSPKGKITHTILALASGKSGL